ncbi:aldehyde-activating protein [Dyella sp. RRB7]|uniref:GFA family protein n=1 Tax=Dyella sp. RRB7 TaxID=2919502 RepID=UPI001FAA4F08|nr:aldehyde-activating protein [Dyella sp. RRB7]
MLIHGQCHCGNIAFTLNWAPDPTEIPARACDCSFCTRHGGVWTSHPDGALQIAIRDASRVSRYAFGTKTAEFLTCAHCGVVPVVTSEIDGRLYAVVNVNAFDNVDPAQIQRSSRSFGNEDAASKLARRKLYWIADVKYVETLA